MVKVTVLSAVDACYGIGKNGAIPWYYKEDLKFFKKMTSGHVIIMGRKTWESLGRKPLPNRKHIVITKEDIEADEVFYVKSFDTAYQVALGTGLDIDIVGGYSVYKAAFDANLVDDIWLTHIPGDWECDVEFPDFCDDQYPLSDDLFLESSSSSHALVVTHHIKKRI